MEFCQAENFLAYNHRIANNKLDIKHVHKSNQDLTERVNVPESWDKSTADVLITWVNGDAKLVLTASDFVEDAGSKLLSCRGKLNPNTDSSLIWINKEHPDAYKRRKLMLRDLIKHINGLEGRKTLSGMDLD